MNCVGHQLPGLWAHPRDRSWQYKDMEHWTDLAKILERGKFDGLFIADVLGIYDVYNGNGDAAIHQAAQVPVNDPLQLIPPMALVTEHLGFGLTALLSFEHPYPFARRLSTLDHLTKGRAGWNIVTSYLESGAKNLGQKNQTEHDARYDFAEEYLEVCYKLWEGSWEEGAILRDRERRILSDPSKIREMRHVGKHFQVPGIPDWVGIGGFGPLFVGSPETVADLLQEWVEETDVDGFNLAYALTHETFIDAVESLVPELPEFKRDIA